MKLKIFLQEVRGYTLMQIIEQDIGDYDFHSKNGVSIVSGRYAPALYSDYISLRGYDKSKDTEMCLVEDLVKEDMLNAISEFFSVYAERFIAYIEEGENVYFFEDNKLDTLKWCEDLLKRGEEDKVREFFVSL